MASLLTVHCITNTHIHTNGSSNSMYWRTHFSHQLQYIFWHIHRLFWCGTALTFWSPAMAQKYDAGRHVFFFWTNKSKLHPCIYSCKFEFCIKTYLVQIILIKMILTDTVYKRKGLSVRIIRMQCKNNPNHNHNR